MGLLSMRPANVEKFRQSTAATPAYNFSQRQCKGACRRRRSYTQFAPGDEVCLTCRRRA